MAKSQLKNCKDCGRLFRPQSPCKRLCDTCAKHRSPHAKAAKKKKPVALTIGEVARIERIYNRVNGTFKHYGEIVQIIEKTKDNRCVCCGDVIPEGRMVCPRCEKKGTALT